MAPSGDLKKRKRRTYHLEDFGTKWWLKKKKKRTYRLEDFGTKWWLKKKKEKDNLPFRGFWHQVVIKKKKKENWSSRGFWHSSGPQSENKWYLDLAREQKTVKFEGNDDISCNWCTWNGCQRLRKNEIIGNKRKYRDLDTLGNLL